MRKELLFTVRSDYQLRCMYAECCGYILMSASVLCIHVGMPSYFARPFVHQSVAPTPLSVRLMIVYHCARRFIFRLSICLIFRPSVCMSVCLYVHMYLCRDARISVCTVDIENWIDLTDTLSGFSLHWTLISFCCFSRRVSNDGIANMCTFFCKNCAYDRQKVHIYLWAITLYYIPQVVYDSDER